MKLSNNGHVGLEIEMLLCLPQFVSGAKFMSKLRFGDTDWECELLFSSTVVSAVHSALGGCDCSSILLLKGNRTCVGTGCAHTSFSYLVHCFITAVLCMVI